MTNHTTEICEENIEFLADLNEHLAGYGISSKIVSTLRQVLINLIQSPFPEPKLLSADDDYHYEIEMIWNSQDICVLIDESSVMCIIESKGLMINTHLQGYANSPEHTVSYAKSFSDKLIQLLSTHWKKCESIEQ